MQMGIIMSMPNLTPKTRAVINAQFLAIVLLVSFACSSENPASSESSGITEEPGLAAGIAAFESGYAAIEKWDYKDESDESKKIANQFNLDFSTAEKHFKVLASRGDRDAQRYYAFLLYVGYTSGPVSRVEAINWYRKSAEQGLPSAQFDLAYIIDTCPYFDIKQAGLCDPNAAEDWYKKAADQGYDKGAAALESHSQYSRAMADLARIEQLRQEALASNTFQFADGTAEWFSPVSAFTRELDLGARFLVIKGNLKNTDASEVMERVQCIAHLTINFSNGNAIEIDSEDICSDAGIGAAAAMLGDTSLAGLPSSLVIGPGKSHRVDTSEGGSIMSTLRGPTVAGKYKPYPVESTLLTIRLVASTPFGDSVEETIFNSKILDPTHNVRFDLQ